MSNPNTQKQAFDNVYETGLGREFFELMQEFRHESGQKAG